MTCSRDSSCLDEWPVCAHASTETVSDRQTMRAVPFRVGGGRKNPPLRARRGCADQSPTLTMKPWMVLALSASLAKYPSTDASQQSSGLMSVGRQASNLRTLVP